MRYLHFLPNLRVTLFLYYFYIISKHKKFKFGRHCLFVRLVLALFWTSGDICLGVYLLAFCMHAMNSPDSPLDPVGMSEHARKYWFRFYNSCLCEKFWDFILKFQPSLNNSQKSLYVWGQNINNKFVRIYVCISWKPKKSLKTGKQFSLMTIVRLLFLTLKKYLLMFPRCVLVS